MAHLSPTHYTSVSGTTVNVAGYNACRSHYANAVCLPTTAEHNNQAANDTGCYHSATTTLGLMKRCSTAAETVCHCQHSMCHGLFLSPTETEIYQFKHCVLRKFLMPPPLIGGGIKRCFCLTSV